MIGKKNITLTQQVLSSLLLSLPLCVLMMSVQSDLSATTITPVPGSPFTTPNNEYGGLAYSPKAQWLACANNDNVGTVSVYDVAQNGVLTQIGSPFPTHNADPQCAAYSPNNQFLVVGNYGVSPATISLFSVDQSTGALTIVNPSTGTTPFTTNLATGGSQLETIYYSPNGKFVAAGLNFYETFSMSAIGMYTVGGNGGLTLAGTFPSDHPLQDSNSAEIAFSPDNMFIAQANYDGSNTITIFSVDQSTGVLSPQHGYFYGTDYPVYGGSGYLSSIAYSPNGHLLVVSDTNNNLFTFTLSDGVPTYASTISVGSSGDTSVVFSPDSQFIALADDEGTSFYIFSVNSSGFMTLFDTLSTPEDINDLAFSPISNEGISFLSGPGQNDITSYAFQFPPPTPSGPSAPTNVVGTRTNNVFLLQTARYLAITWTASTDSTVVSYNIYNGTTLVGNVLATSPLTFNAFLPNGDTGNNFFVTAVNSSGAESVPMPVMTL